MPLLPRVQIVYSVLQPKQKRKENENENAIVQMHACLEEKLFWREATSFQKDIKMARSVKVLSSINDIW